MRAERHERLIEVDYDKKTGEWTVCSRPTAEQDFVVHTGPETELGVLLDLAHDIVTGG